MSGIRDIKRRIKSINNTKKITKAMEMIASAKMRKATQRVVASRPYAQRAWQILQSVTKGKSAKVHPLLVKRDRVQSVAVIVISSNRGLCGSLNQQILKVAEEVARDYHERSVTVSFISVGKKVGKALVRRGYSVVADYVKPDAGETILDLKPIIDHVISEYIAGTYDEIDILYTDYISSLKQEARVKRLLPFSIRSDSHLGRVGTSSRAPTESSPGRVRYAFEPSVSQVLTEIIPRIVETYAYQALLESNASEHAARMLAMRNASDSAGTMIDDLTLTFNQARQAGITREIAEIAAGKAALE